MDRTVLRQIIHTCPLFSADKEEASEVREEGRGTWTERCVRDPGPPVQGGEVGRCVQRAHRSAPGQRYIK
jgi:hypothetical protein